jgi:hypothetical protein
MNFHLRTSITAGGWEHSYAAAKVPGELGHFESRRLSKQLAHDWKPENWPRRDDDFFDMYLARIIHR